MRDKLEITLDCHIRYNRRRISLWLSNFDCRLSLADRELLLAVEQALPRLPMDYRLTDAYERRLRPLYDALDAGNWKVTLEAPAADLTLRPF